MRLTKLSLFALAAAASGSILASACSRGGGNAGSAGVSSASAGVASVPPLGSAGAPRCDPAMDPICCAPGTPTNTPSTATWAGGKNKAATCATCENNACPRDVKDCTTPAKPPAQSGCSVQPDCSDYDSMGAPLCQSVLTCIRRTNCISDGNLRCFCGTKDAVACQAASTVVDGACATEIRAAFPSSFKNTEIFHAIGDVAFFGGGALSKGECDYESCGPSGGRANPHNHDCVPYCL
jgi:hypothetical protein